MFIKLSLKLAKVMREIISKNQSAFNSRRQILDASLIASVIVEDLKCMKKKCLDFKLDFKKANDRVNLGFLDEVLKRKGFGERWMKWIGGCLSSVSIFVILNGQPKGWLKGQRRGGGGLGNVILCLHLCSLLSLIF